MALSNIKKANKKRRREARRKLKQQKVRQDNLVTATRYRRSRKILIQGQKEYNERRRPVNKYVEDLAAEL